MAANGRPTPQPKGSDQHPRFQDRTPHDYRLADLNPFVATHRTFGPELLPAGDAWRFRGRWKDAFHRDAPLHVEIGSGNGFFLAAFGAAHADCNVLGIELRYKRTVLCAKKIRKLGLSNTKIARYHAGFLDDLFAPQSLSGMYVNHPDPWPKERHDKHRLISRWFMEDVSRLLKPRAVFRLKSDFKPNVERAQFVLDHDADGHIAPHLPLRVTGIADDVNTKPAPWQDDFETNYQRKFKRKGLPVYAIELTRTDDAFA